MIKTLREFLLFPLFVVLFVGALFLGMDQYCVSDANKRLPRYPDAQRIEETHNGLRPRGVGTTLEVFLSQDNQETIEAWYADLALKAVQSGKTRGVANLSHWLEPDESGQGIRIYNLSQCVM
jgi:hypothetical protein